MKRIMFLMAFVAIAAAVFPETARYAFAEDMAGDDAVTLEAVVVTAEKRAEDAQKVASSMSVFDAADIEDMDIRETRDLAEYVPNMEFRDFGSKRHGLLFMRGIKSLPNGQAGTGFTLDGLSYSKAYMFMGFPLFDVDRVEVLRGAQGILYGRNTTAGVVNIYTAEPGDTFSSRLSTSFGNDGARELRVNASGPLVDDKLYIGLYGMAAAEDSYMKNDIDADGRDGRHKDGKAGRLKLRYEVGKDWKTTLTIEGQRHEDGSFPLKRTERNGYVKAGALGTDGRYKYSHDFEGTEDNAVWSMTLNSALETGIGTVHSITGFQNYDCNEWIDADASPFDAMRKNMRLRDKDLSQEFRLTSPDGEAPFRWIAGTYLFHFDGGNRVINHYGVAHPRLAGWVDDFDTTLRNTGAAVFGEGTYTLFSRLDLTLGLRGEYERTQGKSTWVRTNAGGVSAQRRSFDESANYTSLLPKVALAWHFTDDVMGYGSVTKAHKVGGYNSAAAPAGSEGYGEEECWLYEIGVKSYLLDRRLMVNAAGFYTAIENEQLPLFVVGTTQGYLANAGESHRTGLELESRYKLTDAWTVSGSVSWIDARFDDYKDAANGIDYSDNRVFCVPEYSYSLRVDYREAVAPDWELFGFVGLSGTGPQYFDDANRVKQGAYELVNVRAGFQWKDLECSLWSRNVFDTYYVAFENTTAGFAEDGRPRTFGASLSYTF